MSGEGVDVGDREQERKVRRGVSSCEEHEGLRETGNPGGEKREGEG